MQSLRELLIDHLKKARKMLGAPVSASYLVTAIHDLEHSSTFSKMQALLAELEIQDE